jgi:hypothetical protein
MNTGKTLFAQVMEWRSSGRVIEWQKGDAGVRPLFCGDEQRMHVAHAPVANWK